MDKIIGLLAALMLILAIAFLVLNSDADCAYCSSQPCYNNFSCGYGCECIRDKGQWQAGSCYAK